MRIGIFGGTFDPPHIGHLILADECQRQLSLDKLLWVVTNHPPHKELTGIRSIEDRLELVRLTIADNPYFEISRVDIDRPGPHYSVDTVKILRKQFPEAELFYLLGGDSLHDLPGWHTPIDFLAACDGIGVMRRHDDQVDLDKLEQAIPGISLKVHMIEAPILEISSHEIRERIQEGAGYRYYLTRPVYQAIQQMKLYRK
jgi:nicotinate-nucleotide adenylyltransferase